MHQSNIVADVPGVARYLDFQLVPDVSPADCLRRLADWPGLSSAVIGLGPSTVARLGAVIEGLHEPAVLAGNGVSVPATPGGLWCWLRGDDRGDLVHATRELGALVADAYVTESIVDAFRYGTGRDLTGYEDGTENPRGQAALQAALLDGAGPGLDGSSFVAVQIWRHDLGRFFAHGRDVQDAIIGRRRDDNEELADAPASAHVKRTAQESFEPAAFVLRRSMPWSDACGEGLVFVAFGRSFDAFEAQQRRMVGLEDGIIDGLFRFTRPLTTSYYWCPPITEAGSLDLGAIGLRC